MELWIERDGAVVKQTLADGEHRLGVAEGVPTELELSLFVESGRLSVEAAGPVRVGGALLPPRLRRLVVPGEPIEPVPGRVFRVRPEVPAAPTPATRAVVRSLLEPGATPTSASLVALTGPDAGRVIPLADRPIVVGRGDGADVRLRDHAISRRHARVTADGDGHAVEDLGTANGVYVNGARIWGTHALEDGSLIEFGRTLLRYCSGAEAGAPVHEMPLAAVTSGSGAAAAAQSPEASAEDRDAAKKVGGVAPNGGHAASDRRSDTSDGGDAAGTGDAIGAAHAAGPDDAGVAADGPNAQRHADPSAHRQGAARRMLFLASGALIVALGVALTVGCLRMAGPAEATAAANAPAATP